MAPEEEVSVPVILAQLRHLGEAVQRIEATIAKDISLLKTEQIAELRKAVDRIADDQRRLWEALRPLERRQYEQAGGSRVIHGGIALVSGFISSIVTLIGSLIVHH